MIPDWLMGTWRPARSMDYPASAHITFSANDIVVHDMGEVLFDRVWQVDSCVHTDTPDTLEISASLYTMFEDFTLTLTRTSPTTISCHFLGVDVLGWTYDVELVHQSRS